MDRRALDREEAVRDVPDERPDVDVVMPEEQIALEAVAEPEAFKYKQYWMDGFIAEQTSDGATIIATETKPEGAESAKALYFNLGSIMVMVARTDIRSTDEQATAKEQQDELKAASEAEKTTPAGEMGTAPVDQPELVQITEDEVS
jgi:hypothetical protein